MLKELSIRNAKRQSKDYLLYFITLACTVSFMYAFNSLIFSDIVKAFPSIGVLPYMIIVASLLIVLIMGWIVGYMTKYILKKRSRELSIYMISGIPNRSICRLIFYENALIGIFAFVIGLPVGILFSQLLEAVLSSMFGVMYVLRWNFSFNATALTCIYFLAMLFYAIRRNNEWISKVTLYDLLYYERQNEKKLLHDGVSAIALFFISVLTGCVGIFLMCTGLLGNGYDVLISVVCLVLFLFGFFLSVPTFLIMQFGNREKWKYEKNRLVLFRGFTAKIRSTSIIMGVLSVLFMLSLTFMGVGTAVYMIADKNMEQSVFDIMILHKAELQDFSAYENVLDLNFPVQSSYVYSIYTDNKNSFLAARNDCISSTGRSGYMAYAEYQHDTYMKQSDYKKLREILGLQSVELNPSLCYIHCVPALKKPFETLLEQDKSLNCAGYLFAEDSIFCEPFSQMDTYGNGLDFCIIVPEQAVSQMTTLYSLLSVITETPLDSRDLQNIVQMCDGLSMLKRNIGKTASDGSGVTALIDNVDYLSGKWVDKESLTQLYAMAICLFYLSLVFEITGAAILATQILSDREKKRRQDCILQQLGMNRRDIEKLNNRQLSMMFLLPLLPALIISSCFVYVSAGKMQLSAFHLPVFSNNLWIIGSLSIAFVFFILLYGVYYIAARISYRRQ